MRETGKERPRRCSAVIPTYNRRRELVECVLTVVGQTVPPDELIVVDDGDVGEGLLKKIVETAGIRYVYVKKEVPDVCESRNLGAGLATGEIVFLLEDDVVLRENYFEEMLKVYDSDPGEAVGGVGGRIVNAPPPGVKGKARELLHLPFLVSGLREGSLLPSGFTVDYGDCIVRAGDRARVDFLLGGVSSFRRKIFDEFRFRPDYTRTAIGEDKDFSLQVGRKYRLLLADRAELLHMESKKMRVDTVRDGELFVVGVFLLFHNFCRTGWWSRPAFAYALGGYLLLRVLALAAFPTRFKRERLKGYLAGIGKIVRGDISPDLLDRP